MAAVPVHDAIAAQARRCPDAVAVTDRGHDWTYAQLLAAADDAGARLRAAGVGRGDLVAVGLPRSFGAIACFLGAHRFGAGYVPIDLSGPRARLEHALTVARVRAGFARSQDADVLRDLGVTPLAAPSDVAGHARPTGSLASCGSPAAPAPAYAIFTSGSTGAPKGVRVGHPALAASVESLSERIGLDERDRVLQFASLLWDTAGEEIYGCLTRGGTLVVDDDAHRGSLPCFLRLLEREAITVLDLPTGFWEELVELLLDTGDPLPASVRVVLIGGEAVPARAVERWHRCVAGDVALVNTYGTTETVLVTHAMALDGHVEDSFAPIGVRQPHVREMLQRLPGVAGADGTAELLVGGPALADGYLADPRLTAERFLPDPDGNGTRLYRTGDLVRPHADGSLAFAGRADRQVKVRGVRLDLGEVESVLRTDADVRCAGAASYRDRAGRVRVGATVERFTGERDISGLARLLREHLPAEVVPIELRVVAELPRLPSGKVDYARVREAFCAAPR